MSPQEEDPSQKRNQTPDLKEKEELKREGDDK